MAACTALVSLMNTIDLIKNRSHHSFSFDKDQIESLSEKVHFFLEFIEINDSSHGRSEEVEDLQTEIASAARLAEDVIESHAVDQILAGSTLDHGEDQGQKSSSFLHGLQIKMKTMKKKVMEVPEKLRSTVDADYREKKRIFALFPSIEKSPSYSFDLERIVDSMREQVMKVKEERRVKEQQSTDSMAAASPRPPTMGKASMVGVDGYLIQLLDVLTGQQSTRQIISAVGMGGIGKTTLVRNVYDDLLILHHFDIRAWATISQVYDIKEILLELLSHKGESTRDTIGELGEQLHKKLSVRRYLIVLDDMWSIEVWNKLMFFFSDNGNGSRIVLTTRISNVSRDVSSSSFVMDLLDEDKSWKLFCATTFGEEECPLNLVEIGKMIVEKCRGLPLSIVVIGGHLRKSSRTKKQWVAVARNMVSWLDSGEDQCLSILSLSYRHLPACLKSCFLYMGVFPEDKEILVSTLIRFWVAEGFLKSDSARSSEEITEDYLKDLVDRNLILVQKQGRNGKILTCNVHDLLRELILKVGEKERFFCVLKHGAGASRCKGCRICKFRISSLSRILPNVEQVLEEYEFGPHYVEALSDQHFSLRYISDNLHWNRSHECFELDGQATVSQIRARLPYARLPSSISLHWNLGTLVISGIFVRILAPSEIWEMPQLRHVDVFELIRLPDPPSNDFVMQNLQTLLVVENFKPSEEVCRRIPNIKQLQIYYNLEASMSSSSISSSSSEYCQNNLGRFHKLESLRCEFAEELNWRVFARNLTYPSTLQELWLGSFGLHWEDLSMIGSLPHLEVFTLSYANSVKGEEWSPIEGEFLRLKSLSIYNCDELVCWNGERSHFPVLETLVLGYAYKLIEFPSDIGEIPTLQCVFLDRCSASSAILALRMLVEQEELGNEDLRLEVQFGSKEERESVKETVQEEGLESNNLILKYYSFDDNY